MDMAGVCERGLGGKVVSMSRRIYDMNSYIFASGTPKSIEAEVTLKALRFCRRCMD